MPSQQPWLPRRSSVSSPSHATTQSHTTLSASPSSKLKGKDRSLDGADSSLFDFGSRYDYNADNIDAFESSTSHTGHDSSLRSVLPFQQYSSSIPSRHRMSLLSVASDAFGFRKKIGSLSRKKPNFHSLSHTSNVVPEVIEISACNNMTLIGATPHKDYEYEERERLRDVAAQSIGLDPELLHDSCKSQSRSSLHSYQSPPQLAFIPPFPATLAALYPFTELSSTLPKFTPPSSLLVYALAKQWKSRTIVLTSHSLSQKTHVHLFKSASKEEKEMERLQVTENSVIFVSEEDVGGRRNVVKFAGKDISAKRSAPIGEENTHTMWFLQISDPADSQRWFAAIKNAVLTQRAVRAGLDIPAQTNGRNEPKGDIDVMLSMHLQGLISTHPTKPSTAISFPSPPVPATPSPPPSLHSLKLNTPSSHSPATAVKGIFTGTRPRSPSVEGSSASAYPLTHAEDSFGTAGTSLLTMLRTKSSVDSTTSPSRSLPLPLPHVSGKSSPTPSLRSANTPVIISASNFKISKERDAREPSSSISEASCSSTPPSSNTPPTPSLSPQGALALSLQPPPRKYKHIVATIPESFLPERQAMYKQAGSNRSVAGNFGISSGGSGDVTLRETSPVSPGSSSWSGSFSPKLGCEIHCPSVYEAPGGGQSDVVPPTVSGNGTVNSSSPPRGISIPSDKLLQSSVLTKRWSRQGVALPKQLTPPSGPPPAVPSSSENGQRTSMESSVSIPITCATDRSLGSSSSNSQARFTSRSGSSLSPTFWKRASGSSTCSVSSTNTSGSRNRPQIPMSSVGDLSTVAKGTSSRPMSLLVPISLPAGHIGAIKRRSMPPPRPAPNFAPPPAPAIQESLSAATPSTSPRRSLRNSVARRALRLSLTSPKPPPSSALPPPPDETFTPGHRRSSSAGTPDFHPISLPPSRPASALSGYSSFIEPVSPSPRCLSIKQRLRILSTPSTSLSPVQSPSCLTPPVQVSTLDFGDDNDDDLPTPSFRSPKRFGLGEHIMTTQQEPSFLQLSTPVTPTAPKPPLHSPVRPSSLLSSTMEGFVIPLLEPDCDFVALSPPPPRRGSKPNIVTTKRPEKLEVERSGSAERGRRANC